MGNLVFQATLGGQVNLVGPNTASTYNINVPTVSGDMVTTGDTGTVTNTMLAGSIANAKLVNSSFTIGSTAVSLGETKTTFTGLTLTNPTINGYTGDTSVVNIGSGQFYKDTSGNVGIGTSSPAGKLDVASGNTYLAGLRLNGLNTSDTIYQATGDLGISVASASNLKFYTNATEQVRINSAGLFQFNSGYGSVATAYGCRAWVNFNGTGTPSITGSGNVTSITDNATGRYTINFTTAMPDTAYAATGSCKDYDNSRSVIFNEDYSNTRTSSTFPCQIMTSSNAAYDTTIISAAFFR